MFEAPLRRKGGAKPQSLEMTSNPKIEDKGVESSGFLPEPFFLTAKFWKRFSVYISVALSIVSLVISSIASLKSTKDSDLKALNVTSIVINALSVTLSAITSLDWQSQATTDRKFAQMLSQVSHVHEGRDGRILILGRERENERLLEDRMLEEREMEGVLEGRNDML